MGLPVLLEIGAEAALFPEKEYINGIAVAVFDSSSMADHLFIQLLDPLNVDNSQTGTVWLLQTDFRVSGTKKSCTIQYCIVEVMSVSAYNGV
jgi:hypothetical protein